MTRTRPASSRGRTPRPHGNLAFTTDLKKTYLKHVARGLTLNEAAAAIGIDRRTINYQATSDSTFRQARDKAKAAGRAARWKGKPHNEYRYNHAGCRCLDCCTAARKARAGRRAQTPASTTPQPSQEGPTVITLPNRETRPDQHLRALAAVS